MSDNPHPKKNPKYKKEDYAANAVFAVARIQLALFVSEGASLHKAANLAKAMQESIRHAYQNAISDAVGDITGDPEAPPFDISPDNPFSENDDE